MSSNRPSGLTITVPPTYHVVEPPAAETPRRRGSQRPFGPVSIPSDTAATSAEQDAIIAALEAQGMQVFDRVELAPVSAPSSTGASRGRRVSTSSAVEFSADLAAHEDAVLLLEQDGLYAWKFADTIEATPAQPARRGGRTGPALKRVKFSVELATASSATREQAKRSVIGDFILDKVKVIVLKFAARIAVGQAIKFLERNVSKGIRTMGALDPQQWKLVDSLATIQLPTTRPARILLFIHGTFSNTVGAFGALAGTPWGRKFLEGARANYDAVIGFDHPTLSEDPLANATELLRLLQSVEWKYAPHFDVITHSRGGLVFRSLVEHLLPLSKWQAYFDRAIFVAAANGGTRLAEPDNWKTLIDLYTNIVVAACKVLGMIPQATAVTLVLGEAIKNLGAFVQYCATNAISEGSVPGLAAMEPDGAFIKSINEAQPGQPPVESSNYYAVVSDFKPRILDGDHEPQEMSRRLVQWLAEALAHQLMQESNDLVVDTPSMISIDGQRGRFIKDTLDFGENPQVYHTNYFTRPEVTNAFARWLRLAEPAAVEAVRGTTSAAKHATVERSRIGTVRGTIKGGSRPPSKGPRPGGGLKGGGRLTRGVRKPGVSELKGMPRRLVEIGGMVGPQLPVAVDTDFIVARDDIQISTCVEWIKEKSPNYVVVRRDYQGDTLNYAFTVGEVVETGKHEPPGTPLLYALNLHETDESPRRSIDDLSTPAAVEGSRPTTQRGIVLENEKPIGVLPEKTSPASASELAQMAERILTSTKGTEAAVSRRAMPKFDVPLAGIPTRTARGVRRSGAQKVTCHFHAEMEEEALVKRVTTVEVIVSREVIGLLTGIAAQSGEAEIEPDRKLIIQVIPRVNFETVDESRVEIDPPAPGDPQHLYFDLRATDSGDGEVWVLARQGQVSLVTLILKPRIVKVKSVTQRKLSSEAKTPEAPKLIEPLHQLRISEQTNGSQFSYFFDLESPALDIVESYRSADVLGDKEKYVENLYEEIEKRWLGNKDDVEAFGAELRAFGGQLFSELIPEKLQAVLWERRDEIKSIMVLSTEPLIPWELVHLKEPGKRQLPQETRFLGQMGLVRWLHGANWPPDQLKIRKGWARYVIPQYPAPYTLPEAEQEYKFLEDKFKATAVEPQPTPVRDLLSKPGQFDLLHFACHGSAEPHQIANAQLMLEGQVEAVIENGVQKQNFIPSYLSATTAEQYSELRAPNNRPMVVLNACQAGRAGYNLTGIGGFAQAFLRGGAGAFIGTLWSVGDSPARTFTETLYSELLNGSTLSEAAIKAREAARLAGDATWLSYVVYGHPHLKFA